MDKSLLYIQEYTFCLSPFLISNCFPFIWTEKIDYERSGQDWNKLMRSSPSDWSRNLETILQWSPYKSEDELLQQVSFLLLAIQWQSVR